MPQPANADVAWLILANNPGGVAMWTTIAYLLAAVVSVALLFTMVYYLIMFSDLEMDYVNPVELCRRLNALVLPEMAAHAALTAVLLLSGQLLSAALNVPLVVYHVRRFLERRHVFEPADIFRHAPYRKRESFAKLGFFLLSFFYYLFRMVSSVIHSHVRAASSYNY